MGRPDSNALLIVGYVAVAGSMFIARRRDIRRLGEVDGIWPAFWVMTGVLVLAMGAGRTLEAGDLLSAIGRSVADEGGWYASRRPVQAVVIGTIGLVWFAVVAVALWRAPERRRRYLPAGVMVVTLAGFAAVQIVSLHQVDSVLYRTRLMGAEIGTLLEMTLLVFTASATLWDPPARPDRRSAVDAARTSGSSR